MDTRFESDEGYEHYLRKEVMSDDMSVPDISKPDEPSIIGQCGCFILLFLFVGAKCALFATMFWGP